MGIKRQVAILGGTFNPVHCGHVLMAEKALDQFQLDQVLWIPAGQPPHKPLAPGSSALDRLEMVKLAIADHRQFAWSDVEMRRSGLSYAIQTVEALQQEFPETQWAWIIGADALQDLPKWHQAERLVGLCRWLVAPRPELGSVAALIERVQETLSLPIDAQVLEFPPVDISSTEIREKAHRGDSLEGLVPPLVARYIQEEQLYHRIR